MMKTMIKKVLQVLFLVNLCICFFPVCVHAEGSTYYAYSTPDYFMLNYTDGTSYRDRYYTWSVDGRFVAFRYNGSVNKVYCCFRSESQVTYDAYDTNYDRIQGGSLANKGVKDGYRWYMDSFDTSGKIPLDVPVIDLDHNPSDTDAYNYTYGSMAVEPTPEPEPTLWGQLRDISYTTSVAGANEASMRNKDIITWGFPYDTNDNDITECEVEIRAVRGRYNGTDKMDLLTKKYTDFVLDQTNWAQLGVYPASQGKAEYTWSTVCNRLNIANFLILSAHLDSEYWIKEGWIYQARLINLDDNYLGEWQTLYTGTSASASGSEAIITNNNFTIEVNQAFQEIVEINNNPSITIIYIDTDYTIENPSNGEEPTGGTSLWDILKQLISGIFQIIAKLGDLVGSLIDGLFDLLRNLFTPSEISETVNNDINIEINTYLEDDQPGLNDIHTNIDTWKLQLEDIAEDYSSGGDCILQWDNVAMDLSVFGAGNVTFIPAGTYDLKTAFLNLLTGFGVSYSTYQMLVSAVIYISLIVLISHKVKGFLKT